VLLRITLEIIFFFIIKFVQDEIYSAKYSLIAKKFFGL